MDPEYPRLGHLDVEDTSEELLAPALFCHKGAYSRTFPCMEATYPYAMKPQRGASKIPPEYPNKHQSPDNCHISGAAAAKNLSGMNRLFEDAQTSPFSKLVLLLAGDEM